MTTTRQPLSNLERLCLTHEPPIRTNVELAAAAGVHHSAIVRLKRGAGGDLVRGKVAAVFGMLLVEFDEYMETGVRREVTR